MSDTPNQQPTAENDPGLEGRYFVKKLNDAAHKHDDCRYFVLDPRHDLIALQALKFYSRLARQKGRFALADDLDQWTHDETERLSEPSVIPPGTGGTGA